jgi:hypothetical protein
VLLLVVVVSQPTHPQIRLGQEPLHLDANFVQTVCAHDGRAERWQLTSQWVYARDTRMHARTHTCIRTHRHIKTYTKHTRTLTHTHTHVHHVCARTHARHSAEASAQPPACLRRSLLHTLRTGTCSPRCTPTTKRADEPARAQYVTCADSGCLNRVLTHSP